MGRVAVLLLVLLCSFIGTDLVAQSPPPPPAPVLARPPMAMGGAAVTRISNRCRGATPTKLGPEELDKARNTAEWATAQQWKVDRVDVYKCKNSNLMELMVVAEIPDNDNADTLTLLFFESHKSFKKALTLHAGMGMKVEYTRLDQDSLWSEGEEGAFVKFLRIVKVE